MFLIKRFGTQVLMIGIVLNLTLENIENYCLENKCSSHMEIRLRVQFYKNNPTGEPLDIYEVVEIERQRELDIIENNLGNEYD